MAASISSALKTYMKTIAGITNLVGSGTAARIHKNTMPQGTALPSIRIEMVAGGSTQHLNGISGKGVARFQVDAYATTSDGAWTLQEAIRLAPLADFRGTMDTFTVNAKEVPGNLNEDEDDPPEGSRTRRFFCSRDYEIFFTEATS